MVQKIKVMLKASTIWLISTCLRGSTMICVGKSAGREIPIVLIILSSMAFGADVMYFYCVKRYLNRIKTRMIKSVKSRILGKALTAVTICIISALLNAILLKIASMLGNAAISFRTLTLLSVAVSAAGTVVLYLFRAKGFCRKYEKNRYIIFLYGKAVMFLLPVKTDENFLVALIIKKADF